MSMNQQDIIDRVQAARTQREAAALYAACIAAHPPVPDALWHPLNEAIIERWSVSGLSRVKTAAWKIVESAG